jgi:molybdopterin molybdotransferase
VAITPQIAEQTIAERFAPLPFEVRPLERCIGHTLRQDVYAERDNPPFDRVCMDGIAIRSEGAGRKYLIEATQPAGAPAVSLSNPANAIEVMTGAVLPRGTDCVVPLEEYDLVENLLTLKESALVKAYRNVQRRGEDSAPGTPMLRAGTRLGAPEIAVVASAGLAKVQVSAQPAFMVISTGDELVDPGQPIAEHQVRRSNVYAVVAALHEHGFERIGQDHIQDDEELLRARLARHLDRYDVLILSGGISKGRFDLVPKALKSLGVQEVFQQVAQQPGRPMWFGIGTRGQAVFGLPGNPVSTLMCLVRYVLPAAVTAMGTASPAPERVGLASAVTRARKFATFMPVVLEHSASGVRTATPRPPNGPGDFLSLAGTDGFIELPPQPEPYQAGFVARFYRW